MPDITPRNGLGMLLEAQSQKHVTINEAFLLVDWLVDRSVLDRDLTAPPALEALSDGDAYLVAVGASGDWAGHGGEIALRAGGGWVFLAPRPGWLVWIEDEQAFALRKATAWHDVSLSVS